MATIVRELEGYGEKCLVMHEDEYFVVSSVHAPLTGFETMVFPADENGTVTCWGEVAGGRGMSREEAIRDLERR